MPIEFHIKLQDEITAKTIERCLESHFKGIHTNIHVKQLQHDDNAEISSDTFVICDDHNTAHNYTPARTILLHSGDKPSDSDIIKDSNIFEKPYRIGSILERIHTLLNTRDEKQHDQDMQIGPYRMNLRHMTLTSDDLNTPIKLTEKERDILALLGKNPLERVERQSLLDQVWGYVDGLETHTLETHIYRLRQKIEIDPSEPKILLTDENGYKISL